MIEDEVLLIVEDESEFRRVLEQLERDGALVQTLAPRLLIVSGPWSAEALDTNAGIRYHRGGDVPHDVITTLNDAERLFVIAWSNRSEPKTRPHDGAPWDADGLSPPDAP